ncbi:ATP-grasp fold amidoligase family protein [Vagococcus fluvialis]|uniref:ATP-grasp fold amidoligase family protein n=1 Tax=Vagococcus fluvialis TaxID=2738 RepID=UPI003B2200ED
MNVKPFLKTIRIIVYKYLFFMLSDEQFIKIQYKIRTKSKLNIKNPTTYNEKIQNYKIEYKNPIMKKCVDKIEVRNFVHERLGKDRAEEILIPLLWSSETTQNIDFDKLPNQFILKLSNGSSFNKIVYDKNKVNTYWLKAMFNFYSKAEYYYYGREWAYKDIKNRFLIEELLDFKGKIPNDYRFFCFNGKVKFITVDSNSITKGAKNTNYNRNLYNTEWEELQSEIHYEKASKGIEKPKKLKEMLEISELLSEGFPHVRVDFYYFDEKIYFGELTFYHASGYQEFRPFEFGREVGDYFI